MGLYSRFGGKEGVLEALFVEGFEDLCEAMAALEDTADPVADLRTCGLGYRAFALGHATHYLVMFGGAVPGFEPGPESVDVALASFERLVGRVQRCVDAG